MTSNYSFYSIPVYWVIAFYPHLYAVRTIKAANNNFWNNANPKAVKTEQSYQKAVPAETYARYERAQAAHRNLMENAPFFIGAVVVGNMAGLSPATLNMACGTYIGLRALYVALYINTTTLKYSFARSFAWLFSVITLTGVYITAGNKIRQ